MNFHDSGSDEETDLEDTPLRMPTEDSDDDLDEPSCSYSADNVFPSTSVPRMSLRPPIPGLALGGSKPGLQMSSIPQLAFKTQSERPRLSSSGNETASMSFSVPQPPSLQPKPGLGQLRDESLPSPPENVTVDLLSQAFVLNRSVIQRTNPLQAGKSLQDQIIDRFSTSLGVAPEELGIYQVAPLEGEDLNSVSHVCVSVNNSTFSLTAIEELLQENKRLVGLQQTYANMSERHAYEVQDSRTRLTSLEYRLNAKEEECAALQQEARGLRDKLGEVEQEKAQLLNDYQQVKIDLEELKRWCVQNCRGSSTS